MLTYKLHFKYMLKRVKQGTVEKSFTFMRPFGSIAERNCGIEPR